MKPRNIAKVLNNKFEDWLKSIDDQWVREAVSSGTIITGGAIASMLLNEKVHDFDVYFKDKETARKVALFYVKKFNLANPGAPQAKVRVKDERIRIWVQSAGVTAEDADSYTPQDINMGDFGRIEVEVDDEGLLPAYIDIPGDNTYMQTYNDATADEELEDGIAPDEVKTKEPYRPKYLSSNAITLSDRIQIVVRFYGEPERIHDTYDFIHCTCHWRSWDKKLVLPPKALESLLTKELIYVGSLYPLCSIFRTRKFLRRGWHISAGQYLKMAIQLNNFDLRDIRVLEDQLTGVDAAYFSQLIRFAKEELGKDQEKKLDETYLFNLINRLF